MTSDWVDLRCFQHCKKNVDLLCFTLPFTCPLCNLSTATTGSHIPPYVIPSPFYSSVKSQRAVVLKVTHGDFVRNYSKVCNLHIGITDRQGHVYDFDEKGLNYGSVWSECLPVMTCNSGQFEAWDKALVTLCNNTMLWHTSRYSENEWNCFDFVLQFLLHIRHPDFADGPVMSKSEFCDNFLAGKTKRAEQYIYLYRQVTEAGCIIVPKKDFLIS